MPRGNLVTKCLRRLESLVYKGEVGVEFLETAKLTSKALLNIITRKKIRLQNPFLKIVLHNCITHIASASLFFNQFLFK